MDENNYIKRRVYATYPEKIKRAVVREYESSNCSRAYLKRKFGLNSANLIKGWVRRYGDNAYLSGSKEQMPLPMPTPEESLEIQKLKQRIKQLERQLEDARILSDAYALMIKKAEDQLNIPIQKKFNTK